MYISRFSNNIITTEIRDSVGSSSLLAYFWHINTELNSASGGRVTITCTEQLQKVDHAENSPDM